MESEFDAKASNKNSCYHFDLALLGQSVVFISNNKGCLQYFHFSPHLKHKFYEHNVT